MTQEREDLERAIAATPDDADIGDVVERLKTATQALALLNEQAGQLDAAIAAEREKLEECERQAPPAVAGEDGEGVRPRGWPAHDAAGRTNARDHAGVPAAGDGAARSIGCRPSSPSPSASCCASRSLVERILIDPTTFAITLYDDAGQAIAKQRLSEGEKQIFAISVLWGLARASARPLPAVIDTPMARLDAAHRQHLVERYFPNASHQVIIFSTDTEVDRQYYQALQPHIARAYHLNYDEQTKQTVGEEGYFWKE